MQDERTGGLGPLKEAAGAERARQSEAERSDGRVHVEEGPRAEARAWKKVQAFGFTSLAALRIVRSVEQEREDAEAATGYRGSGLEAWRRIGEVLNVHPERAGTARLPVYYRAIEAGSNPHQVWEGKVVQLRQDAEQLLGPGSEWRLVRTAGGEASAPRPFSREEAVSLVVLVLEDAHEWRTDRAEDGALVFVHDQAGDVLTLTPRPRFHMRSVNEGVPERIPSHIALGEINAGMMEGKREVREMSASGSSARILYKDHQRGLVALRPATPEETAAPQVPPGERHRAGERVVARRVRLNPKTRKPEAGPELAGIFVCFTEDGRYRVRDPRSGTVSDYLVREVRPAAQEETEGREE